MFTWTTITWKAILPPPGRSPAYEAASRPADARTAYSPNRPLKPSGSISPPGWRNSAAPREFTFPKTALEKTPERWLILPLPGRLSRWSISCKSTRSVLAKCKPGWMDLASSSKKPSATGPETPTHPHPNGPSFGTGAPWRGTMNLEMQTALVSEKPVLRNLLQLCLHDYSEFN